MHSVLFDISLAAFSFVGISTTAATTAAACVISRIQQLSVYLSVK